jgi:hypothetical protein
MAVCGYAVGASNPSGGICNQLEDRMAFINPADLQAVQPWAPVIAASIAAGVGAWVAHKFGRIQAGIAAQQAETAADAAKTAKKKLKIELFERRWAMYQVATNAIRTALSCGGLSSVEEYAYLSDIKGARWIFNDAVEKYLSTTLWQLFTDFKLASTNLNDAGDREDRAALALAQSVAHERLFSQFRKIDEVFDEHLQLES